MKIDKITGLRYQARSRSSNYLPATRWRVIGISYILAIIVLVFSQFQFTSGLRSSLETWISWWSPAQMLVTEIVVLPVRTFTAWKTADIQLADLQRRNAELRAQLGELKSIENDYRDLKAMIESTEEDSSSLAGYQPEFTLTANVIPQGRELWLNVGSKHGVAANDLVFYQGILIGKIVKLGQFFSRTHTIDGGELSLVAETGQGSRGVVEGGADGMFLNHVPADQPVELGDIVYTVGSTAEQIDRGLVIGEVVEVVDSPTSPTKQARISQMIDIWRLRIVTVQGRR